MSFRPKWFHLRDELYFAKGEKGGLLIKKNQAGVTTFKEEITTEDWRSYERFLRQSEEMELAKEYAREAKPRDDDPVPQEEEQVEDEPDVEEEVEEGRAP